MNIGKRELVALAREIHGEKTDFEKALQRCHDGLVKKVEKKLWDNLVEKYPERDFVGEREYVTRKDLRGRLKTVLKG